MLLGAVAYPTLRVGIDVHMDIYIRSCHFVVEARGRSEKERGLGCRSGKEVRSTEN